MHPAVGCMQALNQDRALQGRQVWNRIPELLPVIPGNTLLKLQDLSQGRNALRRNNQKIVIQDSQRNPLRILLKNIDLNQVCAKHLKNRL